MSGEILQGLIVPGYPHPLLAPEANDGYAKLRAGFERARDDIQKSGADLLLVYSTQWISIIGHQMQADPQPVWTLVDPEWHM